MNKQSLILLVEDDENAVLLIRRALAKAKVSNPIQALNQGDAAIAYLKGEGPYADREKHPLPGLVLLDLRMAGKDGFEVLLWIRNKPELKDLRVVALTSSSEIWDMDPAYHIGANSFLVKPPDFENVDALVAALEGRRIWPSPRAEPPS
jgi:CheY-like chemotaxis protein